MSNTTKNFTLLVSTEILNRHIGENDTQYIADNHISCTLIDEA